MSRLYFLLFIFFLIFTNTPANADYSSGQQAYDSGNYREAFTEWQASAKQGNADSQYELGKLYEEGLGVPQNFVLAHLYFNLAASQGNKEAREARNAISEKMAKEQLTEAQKMASNWRPQSSSVPPPPPPPAPVPPPPTRASATSQALFVAAKKGNVESVKRILQAGVDVNASDADGWTALMFATFKGHKEVVQVLLDAGANVNAQSQDGTTPLMTATFRNHPGVVQMLMDAGADQKKENSTGVTARIIAEKKGHVEIAKLLTPPIPEGMVEIPGGSFNMGLDPSMARAEIKRLGYNVGKEEFINNAGPVHVVVLDNFFIDKYEVTASRFAEFLNATGQNEYLRNNKNCNLIYSAGNYHAKSGLSSHPANCMTWYEAKKYCEWKDKRLSTEAEWEKAARGGRNTMYPWGDRFDGRKANFCDRNCPQKHADKDYDDGHSRTASVGSFSPNDYGLYDMAGNVWEWVNDWYDEGAYRSASRNDPQGPSSGSRKVLRGGSWDLNRNYLRTAYRNRTEPVLRNFNIGFRCVQ